MSDSFDQAPDGALDPPAQPERSRRRRRRRLGAAAEPSVAADTQRTPAILLAVAVVGSVLAIGTVHLPVLMGVAAVVFAAATLAVHRQAQVRGGVVIPLPSLIFAGLAAYTLLQTIPMPLRWLEAIAPANADVWARALLPFGEGAPAWAPISLDPGASRVEVLRWATYAAAFTTASAVAARHGAAWGVLMVFGAALSAALITLGHGLLGATRVYGLYQPHFRALAWHIGPLLNPNNLAGYLNLGALSGLGLVLSHRPPIPRWAAGLGVMLIVAIDVTTASRGGVLALPVGLFGLALLTRRRHRNEPASQSASTWLIVLAVAGGAVLAVLGGSSQAWTELWDKNLSKLQMLLWIKPMLRDHAWLGVGRGAFESVFPAYRVTPGNDVFTHAENFVAQWSVEWGLPVALAALGALAWAFSPRRIGAHRHGLAAGAWVGVAALLLQNLVDLGLEIPAVCIGAATVLGSIWGDPRLAREPGAWKPRSAPQAEPTSPARAWAPALAVAVLGAAALGGVLDGGGHDVAADRLAVRAALAAAPSAQPAAFAPVRAALRSAMLAHPAEPYFALLGGEVAFRARDQSAIPWIQRALERGQMNGRAHHLLARVLASLGSRRQALLELRLAMENDSALVGPVAMLAVRWAHTFDDLLSTVPDGKDGAPLLAQMGRLLLVPPIADPILRGQCDREAILRDPMQVDPRLHEVEARFAALAAGDPGGICASLDDCRAEILEHADALAVARPDSSRAVELRARLLVADGKPVEAVRLLEKGCERVSDRPSCLSARVVAAAAVKAPALLDGAAKDLLGAACYGALACADTATWLAGVRLQRNEVGTALSLLLRAAREDPNSEERWMRVADVAGPSGAHAQAADALEKVAKHRGGADPALKGRIDAERREALGGMIKR